MKTKQKTDKIEHVEAHPIDTGIGEIHPRMGDDYTDTGKKITVGSFTMGYYVGEANLEHGGKKYKLHLSAPMSGGLEIQVEGGRSFRTKTRALVEHAIEHGLLKKTIKFLERKP